MGRSAVLGGFGLGALASASVAAFFGFYALAFVAHDWVYLRIGRWHVDPNALGATLLGCAAVLAFAGLVALHQASRLGRRN